MKAESVKFNKELIEKSRYSKFQDFHNLMQFRVRDILLVSSLYDSYIFEEDNRLYELIRQEYQGLNLSHSPELVQVSSSVEAFKMIDEERRFDLIIATMHIEDMSPISFAKRLKESGIDIPIILLGYDNREMIDLVSSKDITVFDKVFIWQGDYKIILGIIKYIEDKKNVENDTRRVGVQSIILVEDSIRFYSSYLPAVYTVVLKQSQSLISEGINLSHKFLRMRARPKILLCSNYEEALNYFRKYEDYILGVISDIDFQKEGKPDPKAGLEFARKVKELRSDVPVILQSSLPQSEELAKSIGSSFLLKDSPTLLEDLRKLMVQYFSFGDFIFRTEEGDVVGTASNLTELEEQLERVPDESILFHASRNHFSNWLKARTEFWLAHQLRPKKVTDFNSTAELRTLLIESVREFRKAWQIGVISDFNRETFDSTTSFARIGGGSLGGKARGLGFVNRLLSDFNIRNRFEGVKIFVPPAVVLATDVFDQFIHDNNLLDFALRTKDDKELESKFFKAKKFPKYALDSLKDFLELVKEPIAVRSSSLLEDSQGQPFAGVYETLMLPNNHPDILVRLKQLILAVKRIYMSVYFQRSKDYFKVTTYRLEEEKMAIIVQKVVGANHNCKYYPEFSGVAKSYNFYPNPPIKSHDGIVSVAPGLGKYIVDGGMTFRFCPKYPQHILQFSTIENLLKYSPHEFFAINLNENHFQKNFSEDTLVKKYNISDAVKDGTLNLTGSTYSIDNNTVYDGVDRDGPKLFTMSSILKYKIFPLPEILELLLDMGNWGTGAPVEIEFAVNLTVQHDKPKEFALLQMRPLVISNEIEELELDTFDRNSLLIKSEQVLGHGVIKDIRDIVCVDLNKFDRKYTLEVAHEIAQFNSILLQNKIPYLLIGMGRWGTLDPWLGIPVTWEQINGARAIIEANFTDFSVTPSQGSHFFQNLTSFKVGYFTINELDESGFIDWNWINEQHVYDHKEFTKHIRLDKSLLIKINGHKSKGIIIKPN
ncbi:MAG: PEP/pyruvate-binding domain-containing protein [Melioribacteraceae bacterium]|nr:PEP/pyruvate-binding domain-containing protein [Melioribacteraceae bacterium]